MLYCLQAPAAPSVSNGGFKWRAGGRRRPGTRRGHVGTSQLRFRLPDFRVAARAEQSLPDRKPRRRRPPGLLGVSLRLAAAAPSLSASGGGQVQHPGRSPGKKTTAGKEKPVDFRVEEEEVSEERSRARNVPGFSSGALTASQVPSRELDSAPTGDL